MKYIPLANLKNTTGIVAFCKEAKEIVRICEKEMGKVVPVLRNGIDELYVMDYEAHQNEKLKKHSKKYENYFKFLCYNFIQRGGEKNGKSHYEHRDSH